MVSPSLAYVVQAACALHNASLSLPDSPSPLVPSQPDTLSLTRHSEGPATKARTCVPSQDALSNGAGAVAPAPGGDGHGTGTLRGITLPGTSTAWSSLALSRQPAAWTIEAGAGGVPSPEQGAASARLPCLPDELWRKIARHVLIAEERTVAAHARLSRVCPTWARGLAGARGQPFAARTSVRAPAVPLMPCASAAGSVSGSLRCAPLRARM